MGKNSLQKTQNALILSFRQLPRFRHESKFYYFDLQFSKDRNAIQLASELLNFGLISKSSLSPVQIVLWIL